MKRESLLLAIIVVVGLVIACDETEECHECGCPGVICDDFRLIKDLTRREDVLWNIENAYNKRRDELFQPLQIEIGNALEAFAKARGINVVIDGATVPLLYFAENTNITRAFIADFNSKNPATAAATPSP